MFDFTSHSNSIYIESREIYTYPTNDSCFNPHILYPEYIWGENDISSVFNPVYDMLREALHGMGYDHKHFATPLWNPLGDIIKPGQTVLLKPNWVSHENKKYNDDPHLTCLVTHPSLVRVILDYVLIALKGSGRIILGDAPMQGTDLSKMLDLSGYNILFDFIKKKNIFVEICDFRKYRCIYKNSIEYGLSLVNGPFKSKQIDLEKKSIHSENDKKKYIYKVSDYDYQLTSNYHSKGSHIYEINEAVLLADVIINIPKPKTHRLAGITGAMKNFVGITYEKASLPHRTLGDKETGKGDAYFKRSIFKRYMEYLDNKQTVSSLQKHWIHVHILNFVKKICYILGALFSGDRFRIGSWYGNDTIWRTVLDLNNIVYNVSKDGRICEEPQRKILNIGDMIICGEKEGPIGPSPKPLGVIMMSENIFLFDYVLTKIMGFDASKIPSLNYILKHNRDLNESIVISNDSNLSNEIVSNIVFSKLWNFEPHSCWKGHIEFTK